MGSSAAVLKTSRTSSIPTSLLCPRGGLFGGLARLLQHRADVMMRDRLGNSLGKWMWPAR